MLDTKHPDMTRLISSRTTLSFEEWNPIHQARGGILPLRGVCIVALELQRPPPQKKNHSGGRVVKQLGILKKGSFLNVNIFSAVLFS
jgi:hypothetical protein